MDTRKRWFRWTRRRVLLLGAVVVVAGGVGTCAYLTGGSGIHNRLAYDMDDHEDARRAAMDVGEVIHRVEGQTERPPNIVLILTDDLGYGDLGCYGCRAIDTPRIDALAAEGVRFTDFYACAPICTPSRAGLLTGRYPHRTGLTFPFSAGQDTFTRWLLRQVARGMGAFGALDMHGGKSLTLGLPASEITLAEALKVAGYTSACIGKWHLGDFVTHADYLPRRHGFDFFIGFNGANDDWPVAFWENETELVEDIALDQAEYTGRFTREAVDFIERSKDKPFFLYLAHKDPHQPCIPSERFKDRSNGGRHGDTVEEVDWSVGQVMACLEEHGLTEDTLVLFTSDNGPWYDGSPGALRGRKGQSFEGGYRVPLIAWWPGKIRPGRVCRAPTMNIDFFPTFLRLAGLTLPTDRVIDGKDMLGLLTGEQDASPHEALFFIHHNEVEGVRAGAWKYFRYVNSYVYPVPMDKPHTFVGGVAGGYEYQPEGSDESVPSLGSFPLLYNMATDPGENYNLIKRYPDKGRELLRRIESFEAAFAANPRGWVEVAQSGIHE